jgi:CheY-like chemotaxis protein
MSPPNVAASASEAAIRASTSTRPSPRPDGTSLPAPLVALIAPTAERIGALRAALGDRYRYAEYSTGEQAWAAIQFGSRFAAVVCSHVLPGMDGADLVIRIRQSRESSLRHLPACLVADTIDEAIRLRARKATVQYLAAFDRSLSDIAPWLAEKLAPAHSRASSSRRTAALRQWAIGHRGLDAGTRATLSIVRLATEGLGDIGDIPTALGVTGQAVLAESFNTVWLCLDQPPALLPRFLLRLALRCVQAGDPPGTGGSAGTVAIAYAPMTLLDRDTYDRLQTLATTSPPAPGHLQLVTPDWQATLPLELVRLLSA